MKIRERNVCDISALVFAFSTSKKLKSSYNGNAFRLRREIDNEVADFGFLSSGEVDYPSIDTWSGGVNPRVVKIYDQSGNGYDLFQNTNNQQPTLIMANNNVFFQGASTPGDSLEILPVKSLVFGTVSEFSPSFSFSIDCELSAYEEKALGVPNVAFSQGAMVYEYAYGLGMNSGDLLYFKNGDLGSVTTPYLCDLGVRKLFFCLQDSTSNKQYVYENDVMKSSSSNIVASNYSSTPFSVGSVSGANSTGQTMYFHSFFLFRKFLSTQEMKIIIDNMN